MTDYVLIHFDLNSWDINIPLRWLLLLIVVKWSLEQITMSESGGFGGEGGGGVWGDSIMMGFGKGAVGYIKHTHRKNIDQISNSVLLVLPKTVSTMIRNQTF